MEPCHLLSCVLTLIAITVMGKWGQQVGSFGVGVVLSC